MPRLSCSSDYLLLSPTRSIENNINPRFNLLTPKQIDQILSNKLNKHLKTNEFGRTNDIDSELIELIDRFFHLTYLNTIPMVNLLATAVATNFLKENIRELNGKFQQEQDAQMSSSAMKRGTSLLFSSDSINDDNDDDDDLSWVSAPT